MPTAQTRDAQPYDASLSDGQLATWRAAEQQLQVGIRSQGRKRECNRHNDSTQLPADLSLLGSAVPAPHFDGSRIGYVFCLRGGVLGYHRDVADGLRDAPDVRVETTTPQKLQLAELLSWAPDPNTS